jgi:Zn-dependent M28 family amino/carboxypeptidase
MTKRRPFWLASSTVVLGGAALLLMKSCGGGGGPVSGSAAMKHVRTWVTELGPTPPGSPEIEKKAAYIQKELKALGLDPQVQTWTDPQENKKFTNVWVEVPGTAGKDGPILGIGAHYDTKICTGHPRPEHNFRFVGAIDGCGGPAVLLELAKVLRERKTIPNVWLIWFDGEESIPFDWDHNRSLFGSRHFVKTMVEDKQRFPKGFGNRMSVFVLLDLVGSKSPKVDQDELSNDHLLDIFRGAAEIMGEKERMFAETPKGGITDDHKSFRDFGVTVINLIDFVHRIPPEHQGNQKPSEPPAKTQYEAWWHTERDNLDAMSTDSLAFFGNLVWNALPGIEQKYYGGK